jgi:hypothetical protein
MLDHDENATPRDEISNPPVLGRGLDELLGPAPSDAELHVIKARARRRAQRAIDIFAANAMTTADVADLLGVSQAAVRRQRQAGRLVAVRRGREWFYPRWQFHDGAPLPRLPELVGAWNGAALELANWAVTANVDLNERRPAHVWRRDPEKVLAEIAAMNALLW